MLNLLVLLFLAPGSNTIPEMKLMVNNTRGATAVRHEYLLSN